MKKAKNIKDIYNIFNPQKYIDKDTKDYYINIYDNFTKKLSNRLILSEGEETIFIAGQSGNGKSSALQLFSTNYPKLNQYYDIKVLNARDIFDMKNIDVADVMLMIAFIIVEDVPELKNEFIESLEKIRKSRLKELEEIKENESKFANNISIGANTGFKFDLGIFKFGADLKNIFKVDNQNKKVIRELITYKKKDCLDIINEIINKYKRDVLKEEKKLLLIVDDIEKIKDSDNIFTDEINTILQIKCSKIITMPIHLKRGNTFAGYDAKEISFKLKAKEGQEIEENINELVGIIDARLESADLITNDAKREIAVKSGGNIRQLIKLVKESALNAFDNNPNGMIEIGDVQSAIIELKRDYSSATMEIKEFLEYIKEHKNPKDYSSESMEKLKIASNQALIFAYYNGEIWFDLNPIILS